MSEHNEKQGVQDASGLLWLKKLWGIFKKVYVVISVTIVTVMILTLRSCLFTNDISWEPLYNERDVSHRDPFTSSELYRVGDTVFALEIGYGYTVANEEKSFLIIGKQHNVISASSLFLSVYQSLDDDRKVQINHAVLEGVHKVNLEEQTIPLNVVMQFEEKDWSWKEWGDTEEALVIPLRRAAKTLTDSILIPGKFKVWDGGVIRVILNVTVGEGKEAVTQNIVYYFQASEDTDIILPT